MNQQFRRGDLVRIAKTMPPWMSHFPCDQDAIVIGSYADQFGGNEDRDYKSYTVLLTESGSQTSWYKECQLTFIRHVGDEGIAKVRADRDERDKIAGDLDWIIANWSGIRLNPPSATISKLLSMVGVNNPWGSHGEGITYLMNAMSIVALLDQVLSSGDKQAIEFRCREIRTNNPATLDNELPPAESPALAGSPKANAGRSPTPARL